MKRYLVLIPLLFSALLCCCPVMATEYEAGLNQAKKENKPLVLYLNTKNCYYCVAMEKTTLADKDIEAILKKDFVFVMADVEKRSDLLKTYPIRGTPTSVFLDPSGKRLLSIPGYIGKSDFKMTLEYVRDGHYKTTDFVEYRKKYAKAEKK